MSLVFSGSFSLTRAVVWSSFQMDALIVEYFCSISLFFSIVAVVRCRRKKHFVHQCRTLNTEQLAIVVFAAVVVLREIFFFCYFRWEVLFYSKHIPDNDSSQTKEKEGEKNASVWTHGNCANNKQFFPFNLSTMVTMNRHWYRHHQI